MTAHQQTDDPYLPMGCSLSDISPEPQIDDDDLNPVAAEMLLEPRDIEI